MRYFGLSFMQVADSGFPRGGGTNPPGLAPTYDFIKFSQNLHGIERIWIPQIPLDPSLLCVHI